MKVFILTEGGANIGFGHVTRCVSISQAFQEKGIVANFIVNGDEKIKDVFHRNVYLRKNYKIFNWLYKKERLFKLLKNADIVIVDSYLGGGRLYKKLSQLAKFIVYIDDNKRIDYPRGIVINGNIYARDLRYSGKSGVRFLLGPGYIPIRKEFWNVAFKKTKQKLSNIMVTFGGDDSKNMTLNIQRFLNRRFPNLKKNIIIGKAFKNINLIKKESDKNTLLYFYPNAKKMKNIMFNSDLAISAAGQTIYELARVGVPTIAITVAYNQVQNAKKWGEIGFLKYAGWYKNKNLYKNIERYIHAFVSNHKRSLSTKIGRENVSGQGARLVVETIMKEAKKSQ